MDTRYAHPTVSALWSPVGTYRIWLEIEQAIASAQAKHGVIPQGAADAINHWHELPGARLVGTDAATIARYELETRHDVAAFLMWFRKEIREDAARWVHFGLTSSDVVDTALGLRFHRLHDPVGAAVDDLWKLIEQLGRTHANTPTLAYTHGQPAEPTSLGARIWQWQSMLGRSGARLQDVMIEMELCKVSGPVGTYAHNPPDVERTAAERLGLEPAGLGCSQVIPRDRLAAWASAAAGVVAVCAKIAVDCRLAAHRGELVEVKQDGQVGSSAMPHKSNPITAEKISGLARLAAGYASMLQPVDLWDERDISHSSVERVAVPDLFHVLLHALASTRRMLAVAHWDTERMAGRLEGAGRLPYTAWRTLGMVRHGLASREQAERGALEWASHPEHLPATPSPAELLANLPWIRLDRPTNGKVG